jgi:hypothetical protein
VVIVVILYYEKPPSKRHKGSVVVSPSEIGSGLMNARINGKPAQQYSIKQLMSMTALPMDNDSSK